MRVFKKVWWKYRGGWCECTPTAGRVNVEGGGGSSVQLLTGERKEGVSGVSDAFPGNSGTVAFRHRGDSELDKFRDSRNIHRGIARRSSFVADFPMTELRIISRRKFHTTRPNWFANFLHFFERNSVRTQSPLEINRIGLLEGEQCAHAKRTYH